MERDARLLCGRFGAGEDPSGEEEYAPGGNILSRTGTALLLAIAGWGAACNFIYADVNVADPAHTGKVIKTQFADGGMQYDIYNQQVNNGSALNKFTNFGIGQKDVANLQLDKVDRQINLVQNRIEIDGVVNAIKDNKIGGDVYFFSDAGIAVGANGVFNVGRLTLGTNAAYGEALYNGGMEKHLAQSAASQAKAVAGGSDITLQGKVYAQSDVVLGAGSVNVKGGEIRTHRNNADTYADKKAAEAYRNQLVNVSPSATVAKALGHGDIALAAVGASSVAKPFETKGAIVIDQAYIDAAGGDTSVIASAERNGGNLMGSKADASVEISNATIQGQNVAISAETKVSGKVGSADAYKTGAEEDGILGLLHATFDEQVGSLASVVKTGADSRVTVKDSTLTAAEDLTISSKAESEIGSETGGALGVGINVGIADVSSKVEIQGTSVLTAEKDLAISAEGSNAIDLQRQGSAEDLPIAIDLGWAEAKTDASVTVAKDATLKAKENVDVSAKAERNLSVEVENSSGDGTLGLAVGVIQSKTQATADVQGKVYADGKVSVSAENTVSDENGKYDPDTLHITSESESDDGTSSDPIHDIVDVATTKGKGNQLMAGIKKLWGDQSTKKKAADAGTSAADQTASTSAGGGLGLNAATAFLFSDNSAKASLAGEVRSYDGASGAGAVDVHAETLSRTKVKAGVSQGADKSAGIAAAVNYIDQNDKAEAELAGDIKSKGNVDVSAETKRPWQSNLEGFGKNLADDLKTIFDPNDGFELSYLTDSWTQTGGAGEKVSGAAALNIMEYNHTAKATVKKDTKVEIDNGDLAVSAKNDIHTVNFSGDIKAPIGDQPGSLDFWEDIGGSPFSGGGKAALGGAALTVHQKNTAEATVEDGVTVTNAKNVSVSAENKGWNLSMAAAGGKGQTVAIDGTVNVNRFENTTKATVGKATINADGDVSVNAEDNSKTINIGGAIAVSGQAGIGATVAYNHIDRQTEASLQGTVTSAKDVSATAKNTGAIYAMSAAGGVTMDSTEENGAGSTGLKAQEGEDGQSTSSIGELAEKLLNAGKSDKDKKEIQKGDSALDTIAGKDASMGENVGAAKGGFAAAANVSVNRITDTAKAYTKGNMVTADALAIRSGNDSKITTGAGAIALGLSQNSQAIAGSFMYNAITDKNEAYAEDATLNLTGSEKNDTSLTVEADNAAKITNIAASGSGASKGSAVAGQISLNWVDNTTDAHVKGGSLEAGKATTISAKDQGTIDSYTGAVAVSGGGNGAAVGASIAANLIEGKTTSSLEDTTVNSGGALSVTADEASQITSIVAAGAASGKFAGAFSASGNYIHTDTDAHISNKNEMKTGALSVLAKNGSNATIGVGSAAIGGNTAGASIGVMVNQSAVSASLTGDEAKEKTITADGITVKADNAYNGDASESDQTAKTVAVGFAGGTSQFAGSGSVTVNVIDQTTDATVGKGVYDAGKKAVEVEATSAAKLFGLAGGVSLSAGSGLGAAVDVQTYKGHTYAGLADGASLTKASSVHVNAESAEHMTSIAAAGAGGAGTFAGAGAAGAHSIATDTKAYIGEQSEVTDAGDVSVTAKDETILNTVAGSVAGSGNTGVGLTAAVEVVNKKASAIVGDDAKVAGSSLTVKAENTSSSETSAAGLGAGGTAGLAGAASETFVTHKTDAHVGKGAQVSVAKGAEILADSKFTQGAKAGSVGGGVTAGMGLTNSTVSFTGDTAAYADEKAVIDGGKKVNISASQLTNVDYGTVAGAGSDTVSLSGTVGVNVLKMTTKAYAAGRSQLSAKTADAEGIAVTASDETTLKGGNGGASIGVSGGGAGAAIGVTNISKDTEAFLGGGAALNTAGKTKISAKNKESLTNVTVQAAGGLYAGLAGAVNVTNLSAVTKAYTGDDVSFNQADKKGSDVTVEAKHNIDKMTSAVAGAAVGAGALGAAVDIGTIRTQTNAFLGRNNKLHTDGALVIDAADHMEGISTNAIAAAVGGFGVAGSVSVYSFGSTMSESDAAMLSGKTSKDGGESSMDDWVNGEINKSQTGNAMGAYQTDALTDVKNKLGTTFQSETPDMGEKGTLAQIGNGSTVTADNVQIKADDKLSVSNLMGNVSAGGSAAGISVNVVRTDTLTQAKTGENSSIQSVGDVQISAASDHQMKSDIVGASLSGGISAQGTEETWMDKSIVRALAGTGSSITSGGQTAITSSNARSLDAKLAGASVALSGALNGAVITAHVDGSSEAGMGDGASIDAKEEAKIEAEADTKLSAKALGAALGTYAGTGTGVALSSEVAAKADVGSQAVIQGKNISVTAKNTPILEARAVSAGLGLAGIGVTISVAQSKDKALVRVGDNAKLTADEALAIRARMDKPADAKDYNAYAQVVAGAGGVVSGAVGQAFVDMAQETKVSIEASSAMTAKKATIAAEHSDTENVEMDSVSAGGVSGTGGETKVTVASDAGVSVGHGSTITTAEETAIRAENVTEKAWRDGSDKKNVTEKPWWDVSDKKNVSSIGAALASGNGVVNETSITHTTTVDLDAVTIKANASDLTVEEKAAGKTLYDKNAIAIDAASRVISKDRSTLSTGAAVGAAHVKNTNSVAATTTAHVGKDSQLLAGETEKAKEKDKSASYSGATQSPYSSAYKGGSIAVGTRNDAELASDTLVDVYGAAGYAGSENRVTYTGLANTSFAGSVETAKGDISAMAGRDSRGETGTIRASAHSDILNATAFPISIKKDPVAKIDSRASLTVDAAANMRSDRDIHLKAKAGSLTALGSGEVKDWVNKMADALGADGSSIGRKEISSSADVTMDGKAETGIHRNKSITIGGQDKQGEWETTVKSDGDISYTYGGTTIVGKELSERLAALREKLADFGADDSTKAAYEAEIQFLEEKMAAQGLGYFETDGKGKKRFIELPSSDTSELEDAKKVLANAQGQDQKITESCQADQAKLDQQKTELTALGTEHTKYLGLQSVADAKKTEADTAKITMDLAGSAKEAAETEKNNAYATLAQKAKAENQSVEKYMLNHPLDESVTHYRECSKAYDEAGKKYDTAKSAYNEAQKAATDKQQEADGSAKAYSDAVTKYNKDYSDTIDTDVTKYDITAIDAKGKVIDQKKQASINWQKQVAGNQDLLANQISATEKFYANDGKDANGTFTKDGASVITVDANGNPVPEGTEGSYYLLHKNVYQQMTHNMKIDDITAQLGDILFEGDNVSGSGTLHAGGDASVSITNASPNTLTVGDIQVVGRGGIDGSGQGGTIFYNDVELKGDMKAAIEKENKDKSMNVGFAVTTRQDTAAPSITVKNTFQPSDYKDGDMPHYAASTTTLAGYIYNPRGSVTVESKNGDVYNDGTIYAGTVDMKVENGDFIQSLSDKKNSIFHVGGAPLDDTGGLHNVDKDSGILANGNIFISARYVNINSRIQSGIADWDLTIPKDCKFYYEDTNGNKMYVQSKSDVPAGRTVCVEGATGRAAEKLSYDFDSGRFIVDDIEVHGGKVSIVGTIINTTNDKSKARIEALDGYGQISIRNDSGKDIELRTLSTGEGTEGRIELTDLDRGTGKIARKTTYTRDGGKIHMSVQNYQNGAPSGNAQDTVLAKGTDGTYTPVAGSYYTLQTGTDKSYTTTYELHKTKVDWWGINDKTPTGQEVLDQGGTITDYKQGDTRTLNGGAIITTTNDLNGGPTGEAYKKTTKTINNKTESIFTQKAKRLWYTVGLAKKFDYKLVEKKYDTTIHQYSQKADYDIGIRFIGDETGGKLNVNGGTGNVIVNGTISNGLGEATLSAGGIQQGARGYIDTNTLTMTATTGSAGTRDAAIKTNAMTVSGSAAKDFGVKVVNHGVTAGSITAGAAAIQAEGDISQQTGTKVHAGRVELASGGAIQGANGSFLIEAGQSEGKDYGLKASAEENISIENTSGDLYLDSVISKEGDVTLKTNGSFIDNNYTDLNDEDASAKLLAWANAAVLEGKDSTIQKQKNLLIAKVEGKYNEFQSLKAHMDADGKYTLDDVTRRQLEAGGQDVKAYIDKQQARYEALLVEGVGSWSREDVAGYTDTIKSSQENIYGNAALTKDGLKGDDFLTQDEKAEALVGSAKSAKDLLITFAPGSIKEGITDTNTTLKGTPHVSGKAVTLTAGEAQGSIGQKKDGMTIDLSDMTKLTRDQLLALSAAERGDFAVQGNQVTVSSIRAIDAEAKGKLQATADKGAIYLVTEGSLAQGSTLSAGDEIRLKASGNVTGVTLTSDQQVVLESGEGAIQGVELKGTGVLTARAKNGVQLNKSDGDLVINTVYASEGDVHLDVGRNSLLAEDGHDTSGDETGTTYTNVEGKNITITNARDIRGDGEKKSLGMKVTGEKAEDGTETPGSITAKAAGNADITLFGKAASDAINIEAGDLTLTSRGDISDGNYHASNALRVHTANGGKISGGTFTGNTADITNAGEMSNGDFRAEAGNMAITNDGTMTGGAYTAKNDLTYKDSEGASLSGSEFTSEEGNVDVNAKGKLAIKKLTAKGNAKIEAAGDATLDEITAGGNLNAEAGGSILAEGENAKISAKDITMKAGKDIRITDRSPVGKLDGVDTRVPAGSTTGSGAAGSLVTGEKEGHDFDVSQKGSTQLSSKSGKVTLSAKKVEIDTLKNGEGSAADLTISADNIGIDDLTGAGAQHVTIHGKDGQSQAHYAGIHSTSAGGTLVKDSKVEHLHLTGREPLGLSNTAIGGDSVLATDKIRVTIQKNPGSSQAEHFGNLSLSGYDIVTDHVMTSVKDGVTVNGERFPVTAESVMNASLYEDRTLGRDGREKEEEAEKDSPSLAFGAPNDKEAYEVVK